MVSFTKASKGMASVATGLNNSILRGFAILGLFNDDRPEISAATVSEELGVNAITAHRFLKTLEHVGAVTAVSRGRFRIGYKVIGIAASAGDPHLAEAGNLVTAAEDRPRSWNPGCRVYLREPPILSGRVDSVARTRTCQRRQ